MRIVQITDTHIFANQETGKLLGLNTSQSFEAVLSLLEKSPVTPDVIILTGDLSQDETELAYRYIAKSLERFKCPIYWIPGNHDTPELMNHIFSETQFKSDKAILLGHWMFVLLNTHYSKHVEGLLSKIELSRLDYYLSQYPKQHTFIFMHHPPVPVGSRWIDNLALKNMDQFFRITDKHSNIKGIICGHVHQEFETTRKSVSIFTSPSTCIQFKSHSKNFALDTLNPGYRWFDLKPNGAFKTGVERVINFKNTTDLSSGGY